MHIIYSVDTFGNYLETLLNNADLTKSELCRRAEMSTSWLSKIIAGTKRPPLDRMEFWAEKIGLNKQQTEKLCMLAALEHVPQAGRKYLIKYTANEPHSRVAEDKSEGYNLDPFESYRIAIEEQTAIMAQQSVLLSRIEKRLDQQGTELGQIKAASAQKRA